MPCLFPSSYLSQDFSRGRRNPRGHPAWPARRLSYVARGGGSPHPVPRRRGIRRILAQAPPRLGSLKQESFHNCPVQSPCTTLLPSGSSGRLPDRKGVG